MEDIFHSTSSYVSACDAWLVWSMRRKSLATETDSIRSEARSVWLTNIVNQATSRHRRQANKKDGTLLFRNRFDCGERSVPSCKHCTTPRAAIYGGSCACIPSGASAN